MNRAEAEKLLDEYYDLSNDAEVHGGDYSTLSFEARERCIEAMTRGEQALRPLKDWNEERGPVVWWKFPIEEPAWIGEPGDSDWPGYHTHWTPHPSLPEPPAESKPPGFSSISDVAARTEMIPSRKAALERARDRLRAESRETLCEDCPPIRYPTDKTRCTECPRRSESRELPEAEVERQAGRVE